MQKWSDLERWLRRAWHIRDRLTALDNSAAAWEDHGDNELYPQVYAAVESERKRLDTVLREITEAIAKVDDNTLAAVLQCRYVNCMTWKQIEAALCYSGRQLHRLHRNALEKIRSIIDPLEAF